MGKLKQIFAAFTAMMLLCLSSVTASAYEYSHIPQGEYQIKAELSCYVNAMGGIEFDAPLLTSARLAVASDGSKTMTLFFTKSSVTIYSVTCDTFVDVSPSYVTETNGIKSGTLGYYNADGALVKVHAIVGQILIIRRHSEIEFDKALNVHRRGVREDFRLKILYETLSDGIDLGFAQNRYAVVLHSKRGSVHLYKLPLSLPELLDELQPVSLACIKVTCRAKRSGHIVVFHDVVGQVWGNRVSLLAGQIVHRSLILVVQHENLGNQLQLLHFGRIAAVLLDVGQIGRSDPYHFRHFAERD